MDNIDLVLDLPYSRAKISVGVIDLLSLVHLRGRGGGGLNPILEKFKIIH